MKTASLSHKLFKQLVIIVIIGQVLVMALVYTDRMRVEAQEVNRRIASFGAIVASSAYRALLDNDFTYLTLLTSDILNDEDILTIVVKDSQGKEYSYQTDPPRNHRLSAEVATPILSREGEVGSVMIAFTFDNIRKKLISHLCMLVGLQTLIVLVLMLLIRYFFRRELGSNLDKIGQQLERVRAGDLTTRIGSSDRVNEIVVVANGLDFLVDHLAATIRKTNHIAGTLQHSVDQTKMVMGQLIDDAKNQQQGMAVSFQLLSDASQSQAQIIEHTSRLQGMAQANGDALSGIKGTFEVIVHTIDSLNDSMSTLHSSIEEFSLSSKGVAGLAEEAAETVNDVSVAMVDINATVKEINDVIHASTELSNRATESISSKGIVTVSNAIDTTSRIESFFNSLSATIIRLDTRSKDITKILNVIHEVTDQVNQLSLNALIIAAQSGDSGNSFVVVAKEMKLLATKAGQSAKEIELIVSSIQSEIAAAVSETQETAGAVNEGKSVAAMTGDVLDEILELSSRSTNLIKGIAVSTGKQNRMIETVNRDISRLLELNQKVKSATGEEEVSTTYLMKAANRISASLNETRHTTEEQFRALQLIAGNSQDANVQLGDIARRSSLQQTVNLDFNRSMESNLALADAMVAMVQKVGADVGEVFLELERLREEMGFFRTGENT